VVLALDCSKEPIQGDHIGVHVVNDVISADEVDDMDPDMVALYRLFGAVEG